MEEISTANEEQKILQALNLLELELQRIKQERETQVQRPSAAPCAESATTPTPHNVVPFPARQPDKPERRAGNAVLMDYLYGIDDGTLATPLDSRIKELCRYAIKAPAARALRARRLLLARAIDETCTRLGEEARILSVGCGHFREADLSRAIHSGRFGQVEAFDSNADCLHVVEDCYGKLGVKTRQGSLHGLITGKCRFECYDLVYSAGLCDLLDDSDAKQLAQHLFKTLRPGGKLILANFRPGIPEIHYLEGLLDWRPHYRTDDEVLDLLLSIHYNDIASAKVLHDIGHRIAFLEAIRYG
ncbi:hypothetical protein FQZ97_802860 [compost metagenome]